MNVEKFYNAAYAWLINYSPRFLLGMLVMFVGLWLIKLILNHQKDDYSPATHCNASMSCPGQTR